MVNIHKILLVILVLLILGAGGSFLVRLEPGQLQAIFSALFSRTAPPSHTGLMEQHLKELQARSDSLQQQVAQLEQQVLPLLPQINGRLAAAEESLTTLKKAPDGNQRLEGGSVLTSIQNMEWRLADLISGRREFRREVVFSTPFAAPPRIVLGITRLEVTEGQPRFGVTAQQVEESKFVLVFETRAETRIREAQVDWLAFGK